MSFLASRVTSFSNAFRGLWGVLATQRNARIHGVATLLVCGAGVGLGVSRVEWCWLVAAIAAVWAAEAFNTALEALADAAVPDAHPLIRRAKDAAAGAVLAVAIGAASIGVLVLGPHLLAWLGG